MMYVYEVDVVQTYFSSAEVRIESDTPLSKEAISERAIDEAEFDGISDGGDVLIDHIKEVIG
jgi:hypothetical protein